jgi:hypothetical protein
LLAGLHPADHKVGKNKMLDGPDQARKKA